MIGAALGLSAAAASAATLDDVKAQGLRPVRRQHRPAGLRQPRRRGQLDRLRRRLLPRRRRGDLRRPDEGASSRRSPPRSASPRCSRARSTCSPATRPGRCTRDTSLGLTFAGVNYYDGQGFMVEEVARRRLRARSSDGASVCVQTGTTTELNLADYFKANDMSSRRSSSRSRTEVNAAYDSGRCDAFTTDASGLYAIRLTLPEPGRPRGAAGDHLQGAARTGGAPGRRPVVQHREVDALRAGERRGVRRHAGECRGDEERPTTRPSSACSAPTTASSARASASATTGPPTSSRRSAITARSSSAISARARRSKIARGLNALWTKGGLQYAPPIR